MSLTFEQVALHLRNLAGQPCKWHHVESVACYLEAEGYLRRVISYERRLYNGNYREPIYVWTRTASGEAIAARGLKGAAA